MESIDKAIKTIGLWSFHEVLNKNNFMLEHANASVGDDLLLPVVELGKYLSANNIKAATLDVLEPGQIDAYLFIDMPDKTNCHFQSALDSGKPLYLLIVESPMIRPENYDINNHAFFRKIFTYNDSQVDGKKYIKLNYAFSFPHEIPVDVSKKDKLCVMIAGKKKLKRITSAAELYSERLRAIQWFERNHPEEFDLFGFGWGRPVFKFSHLLNPLKAAKALLRVKLLEKALGCLEQCPSCASHYPHRESFQ